METENTSAPPALALLAQVCGTPLEPQRLRALLADCRPILDEIARLREVDLADLHPALIFDPTAPYRRAGR
jgi:hypothetical protein